MYLVEQLQPSLPSQPKSDPPRRHANGDAIEIVKSFNTWAFKREQPSSLPLLHDVVANRIDAGLPVSFVLYWGKGPRATASTPEADCMSYLSRLADKVRAASGMVPLITLCLTDTHARLNGHDEASIKSYFGGVQDMATKYGFETTFLSKLVETAEGISVDEQAIPEDVMMKLVACAQRWYRGEGDAEAGALTYLKMNMVERRAIECHFPNGIFVTFNGSDYKAIFPSQLPIFYMYSLRRGHSPKPWFLDESGQQFGCAAPI
jgi:hypothetical protein